MTDDDFLRQFHARHPGATARALARGRFEDGRSSYEVLAALAPPGRLVLDLGCGDGYLLERLVLAGHLPGALIGLDRSPEELALARRRLAIRGARLVCARAEALPLGDRCAEVVLSHLAFTLMGRLDAVVGELARVLVPGGRFAAIVGGGPKGDDAFEAFLGRLSPVVRREAVAVPRLGDLRARSDAGLAALFSSARGFSDLRVDDLALALDGTAAEVWDTLATSYELAALPAAASAEVRTGFLADATALADRAGRVPCTMALRLVVVERARGDQPTVP